MIGRNERENCKNVVFHVKQMDFGGLDKAFWGRNGVLNGEARVGSVEKRQENAVFHVKQ